MGYSQVHGWFDDSKLHIRLTRDGSEALIPNNPSSIRKTKKVNTIISLQRERIAKERGCFIAHDEFNKGYDFHHQHQGNLPELASNEAVNQQYLHEWLRMYNRQTKSLKKILKHANQIKKEDLPDICDYLENILSHISSISRDEGRVARGILPKKIQTILNGNRSVDPANRPIAELKQTYSKYEKLGSITSFKKYFKYGIAIWLASIPLNVYKYSGPRTEELPTPIHIENSDPKLDPQAILISQGEDGQCRFSLPNKPGEGFNVSVNRGESLHFYSTDNKAYNIKYSNGSSLISRLRAKIDALVPPRGQGGTALSFDGERKDPSIATSNKVECTGPDSKPGIQPLGIDIHW